MATAELHSMMEAFKQQMQQQHTAFQAVDRAMLQMLTNDRGHQTSQGVDAKFYKELENFNGEQNWRDWSFQFKSATKNAQQEAYHLLE